MFEASQERRRLLEIAPHLVRPLEFLFPIFEHGRVGRVKLDAGMWLYDALSLFRNIERHQMLDEDELLEREPGLRREGLLGGARYFDAQVDDARLTLTTALGAMESGAVVLNRVELISLDTSDWPGHRATVRDAETGEETHVDALSVVIATGPWTEQTLERAGSPRPVRLAPSRGTHIHVRRERVGHEGAFIFEAPRDRRIMFVLPWREDLTLIGTTDEFHHGAPETVAATPEDIRYLLDATNSLFPDADLGPDDVLSAWAGLRPLVAPDGGEGDGDAGNVSREFDIHESPPGVFTLTGGKLTSHRHMAEETVDRVAPFLAKAGVKAERKTDTGKAPLPGGDFDDLEALSAAVEASAAEAGVPPAGAARLTRAYGTRADAVLDLVRERPELAEPMLEGRPHILAEAVYGVRHELALHVEDVLYRRTRVGLETRDGVAEAAQRVGMLMADERGWDRARLADEIEGAVTFRAADDAALEAAAGPGAGGVRDTK